MQNLSKHSFIVRFMNSLSLPYDKAIAIALTLIMLVHTKPAALTSVHDKFQSTHAPSY